MVNSNVPAGDNPVENDATVKVAPKVSNKSVQEVDIYAGKQLRILRKKSGVSQKSLAELTGTTFQQIQKYEKGINRMSLSRIYLFCKVFGCQPAYFFFDNVSKSNASKQSSSGASYMLSDNLNNDDDLMDIVNLCKKITQPDRVKLAKQLLKSLAK